jgi:hypothetical protein
MKRPKSRATKVRTVSLTATKFVVLMGVFSMFIVAGPRARGHAGVEPLYRRGIAPGERKLAARGGIEMRGAREWGNAACEWLAIVG